jgi:hypothetical protein
VKRPASRQQNQETELAPITTYHIGDYAPPFWLLSIHYPAGIDSVFAFDRSLVAKVISFCEKSRRRLTNPKVTGSVNALAGLGLPLVTVNSVPRPSGPATDRFTGFLQFFIGSYEFPSFNVADSAITLGATLLLLDLWKTRNHPAPQPTG